MTNPPLRFLHSLPSLIQSKLDYFRTLTTDQLVASLRPGEAGALKAKADGTLMDGHHRLAILRERGVNVNDLPRESYP
jgi:hypothetical protein